MDDLRVQSLEPFVPSGKQYDASRRLFSDLGFEEVWESEGYAGFRSGEARFILQKFDDERSTRRIRGSASVLRTEQAVAGDRIKAPPTPSL